MSDENTPWTKEEIILLYLKDPIQLIGLVRDHQLPPTDEMKRAILDIAHPRLTYCLYYAYWLEKDMQDEARTICCTSAGEAFWFAYNIDRCPRDDTRTGACAHPKYAFWYATDIDKKPTEETERATQKDILWREYYRRWKNAWFPPEESLEED